MVSKSWWFTIDTIYLIKAKHTHTALNSNDHVLIKTNIS